MSKNNALKKAEIRKREQITRKKKTQKIVAISIILIAIISIVIVISMSKNPNEYDIKTDTPQETDIISETAVGIPISDIDETPSFYSYDVEGVIVKYFVVKGSDGDIHAAFDACDVCYHEKKGYRQKGDVMQCINCGLTFPINNLGSENTGGGCWPSYLPITIEDDHVIIKKSDLAQKKWMF